MNPGSPRERGILDWNLHNSGIILAVSESGPHRIVVLGFGWKTEGNQAEFLASMQQLISKVAVGNSPSANNYNT